MRRKGNMQFGQFVAPATTREGCDWTVYVDLGSALPTAIAVPAEEVPADVFVVDRARRSCEAVARSIARQMNAARDAG